MSDALLEIIVPPVILSCTPSRQLLLKPSACLCTEHTNGAHATILISFFAVRPKLLLRNQGGFRGVPHVFQRRSGNFRPLRAAFHEEVSAVKEGIRPS